VKLIWKITDFFHQSINTLPTYIIITDTTTFEADAVWDPWSQEGKPFCKPSILFSSDQWFMWKGNKQTSARVEIDPELLV
jgi:hypothetical protein